MSVHSAILWTVEVRHPAGDAARSGSKSPGATVLSNWALSSPSSSERWPAGCSTTSSRDISKVIQDSFSLDSAVGGANDLPGRHTRAAGKSSEALSGEFSRRAVGHSASSSTKTACCCWPSQGIRTSGFSARCCNRTILVYSPQGCAEDRRRAHQLSASDPGVVAIGIGSVAAG